MNKPLTIPCLLNLLRYNVLALPGQIDPKKAPALDTISTALPTSVPSSNALALVGLSGVLTMPLGACGTVALAEEDCAGATRRECFMVDTGEFEGVGCLDLCNCSSSVPLGIGMDIGVDNAGPGSQLSVDTRSGLLLWVGTAVDAAETVDEPEEVDEFEAGDTIRFPSPNRPNEEVRTSSALPP